MKFLRLFCMKCGRECFPMFRRSLNKFLKPCDGCDGLVFRVEGL